MAHKSIWTLRPNFSIYFKHYITCSARDPLLWMGAVRIEVQTADKNITIIHTTTDNPLVSKWCNAKVLQIGSKEQKLIYILVGQFQQARFFGGSFEGLIFIFTFSFLQCTLKEQVFIMFHDYLYSIFHNKYHFTESAHFYITTKSRKSLSKVTFKVRSSAGILKSDPRDPLSCRV